MSLDTSDPGRHYTTLRTYRKGIITPENGKLILVEAVVPASNEPTFSKFIDLNMLVMTGGRERTEEEFRALYQAAGFRLTRVVPTDSRFSVIEGVRV